MARAQTGRISMGEQTTLIVVAVGLAAGGGLYLWWKSQQAAPQKSDCEKLCDLVPDVNGAKQDCLLACGIAGVLGQVAGAVSPFHDSSEQFSHEQKRRAFINNKLNGGTADASQTFDEGTPYAAPAGSIPITDTTLGQYGMPSWLNGGVYRYPNGCVPFFGAPGWYACPTGTLDEYGMALDAATPDSQWGYNESSFKTVPYFLTIEEYAHASDLSANQAGDVDASNLSYAPGAVHANKSAMMTGGYADPASTGPWKDKATGLAVWRIRGQNTKPAPAGMVPRAVAISLRSGMSDADALTAVSALTDAQAMELVPIPSGLATGVRTQGSCDTAQASGLTYDPTIAGWRRIRAGETFVTAPGCATSTPTTKPTTAVFGFGILGL